MNRKEAVLGMDGSQAYDASPMEASPSRPVPESADVRRVVRASVLLAVGVVLATALLPLLDSLRSRADLAKGKPWRASSTYAVCRPEALVCGEASSSIFFHTNFENQPWVEIDLGAPTTFSSVVVRNRRDGPQDVLDRAVPLILEVGDDQQHWTQLSEITHPFTSWRASVNANTARYVRLRSPRQTYLHLDAVQVFP
jgi:hypothetical protein